MDQVPRQIYSYLKSNFIPQKDISYGNCHIKLEPKYVSGGKNSLELGDECPSLNLKWMFLVTILALK